MMGDDSYGMDGSPGEEEGHYDEDGNYIGPSGQHQMSGDEYDEVIFYIYSLFQVLYPSYLN